MSLSRNALPCGHSQLLGWQGGFWDGNGAAKSGAPGVVRILANHGFDKFVEDLCGRFYAEKKGRPGLAAGVCFRTLFIGYFEGTDSERGMAWRIEDSLNLRSFLGLTLADSAPGHSTLSRTRRLIDVETHDAVFGWMPKVLLEVGGD